MYLCGIFIHRKLRECGLHRGDIGFRIVVEIFLKIVKEVDTPILFQPVTLAVHEKLLLTLKPYLLGECEGVLVLQPLLCGARMHPNIEIEVFLFLACLTLNFGRPFIAPSV